MPIVPGNSISTQAHADEVLDAPEVIEAALAFMHGKCVGERIVASPNLPFGVA